LWDARSGQEALTLPLPEFEPDEAPPQVAALAWSADGKSLRAALRDGSVLEWEGRSKTAK
jgi:hypothetical protein